MDRLSPDDLALVTDHYFRGLSWESIAGRLGRTASSVRHSICRIPARVETLHRRRGDRGGRPMSTAEARLEELYALLDDLCDGSSRRSAFSRLDGMLRSDPAMRREYRC